MHRAQFTHFKSVDFIFSYTLIFSVVSMLAVLAFLVCGRIDLASQLLLQVVSWWLRRLQLHWHCHHQWQRKQIFKFNLCQFCCCWCYWCLYFYRLRSSSSKHAILILIANARFNSLAKCVHGTVNRLRSSFD